MCYARPIMTDTPEDDAKTPSATAAAARLALQLKQASARAAGGRPDAGRASERAAAARSASKSRPALRK